MKSKVNFSNIVLLFGLLLLFIIIPAPWNIALSLEHSGTITTDETWTAADNPHEITANVTVNNLVTLTLEPGVEVLFKGNYWIGVYGALMAEGLNNNNIRFTRAPGVANWYGLYLYEGAGGTFSHCIIEWAGQRGISADSCYLSVSNCTIRHNGYGIYATAINPYLADNVFENNETGLRIGNYYAPVLQAAEASEGMMVLAAGENNIIRENDTGLYFYDCIRPTVAETALIYDNTTYGVRFQNCAHPAILADVSSSGTGIYYQNCTDVSALLGVSLTDNVGTYGAILAQGSGPVSLGTGNTISDNSYPLSIDSASYATESSQLPATGNHTDGIQVISGTSQQDADWYAFGLPYILTADPTIGASGSLTLESGVTVRLDHNVALLIYGDLQTNGTSESGITFTRNQASRWNVLRFYSGSTGLLAYTNMEFAKSGVYVTTAAPELDSCTLRNNTQGYYGYSNATSSIHDCLITNNDYGIRLRSGSDPVIYQNCIMQNHSWGMYNAGTTSTVDAEDNFWGDATGPRHISNSDGRGDFVSDWVDFDPWLASCPL